MTLADSLSRATNNFSSPELSNEQLQTYVHSIVTSLPVSSSKLDEIQKETSNDETLKLVSRFVEQGWPSSKSEVPDSAKSYYKFKDDISIADGILLKGMRIIIPYCLRKEMKVRLHTRHIGIERTKMRARETIYWPGIDSEIDDMISNCSTCLEFRNKLPKEPLISHEVPNMVWTKLGTDLFNFNNNDYLIVVDYTSKFFEVSQLPDTTAETVINHTKSILSRHGIPETIISDNGPQFKSHLYAEFIKKWEIQHKTSSPEYPQSNGMVERTIQTVKRTLYKAKHNNEDAYLAILHLRTTPTAEGISPASYLMKRNLRTLIPSISQTQTERQHKGKDHQLKELCPGDTVRFQQNNRWS